MCNFIPEVGELKNTAQSLGFSGIDWTFTLDSLPRNLSEESRLLRAISSLDGFEIRYHCAFSEVDIGDVSTEKADAALNLFLSTCRLVHFLGGKYMTIHIGLGRDRTAGLSWERSIKKLKQLVRFAQSLGITICLENLASGWSSRPELFEKLIRKADCAVTLDIGHALVSPSVQCQQYSFEDFIVPHRRRILNAHIYHEETDNSHVAPKAVDDMKPRLDLLRELSCDWWVLELREMAPLISTLDVVREYLESQNGAQGGPPDHAAILGR